jgi:hypothetical protein
MKIIISENQKKNLLKSIVKKHGWEYASKLAGEPEELAKLAFDNDPMEFLHMFDDMGVVQSKYNPNRTLYRYEKGHNLMVYDRKTEYVYIDYSVIWSVLKYGFGVKYSEMVALTTRWVGEAYNLRGVTISGKNSLQAFMVGEAYNLRGETQLTSEGLRERFGKDSGKIRESFGWMNHTN